MKKRDVIGATGYDDVVNWGEEARIGLRRVKITREFLRGHQPEGRVSFRNEVNATHGNRLEYMRGSGDIVFSSTSHAHSRTKTGLFSGTTATV
ncbi:MAG TPA: hypothetical protein VKZ50_01485 [bacterium]|nr:hypothetical protein [bacterium]